MLQRHSLAFALFIMLGALAYSNSLSNQFVHDDNYQIVRNPYLHSDESLTRLLFSDVWGYQTPGRAGTSNYYRPLQMLAYRWIAQSSGLNPSAFHWVNLVLHLMVSATAYLIFWHLTRNYGLSLSGAVLFVLHPIHTEAVDWIASLPELGCALFYFLSFWLFLSSQAMPLPKVKPASKKKQSLQPPPDRASGRTFWHAASLFSFAVSLLFKEMALTVPLIVGTYALTFEPGMSGWRGRIRASVQKSWPYLVVAVGYLALRYEVLGFISKSQQVWSLSLWAQFLSILHLATQYWYKLLLPINLNAFYTFQPVLSAQRRAGMDSHCRCWNSRGFHLVRVSTILPGQFCCSVGVSNAASGDEHTGRWNQCLYRALSVHPFLGFLLVGRLAGIARTGADLWPATDLHSSSRACLYQLALRNTDSAA